jgi:hypothetical protein
MSKRKIVKRDITEEQFLALLSKTIKSDSTSSETSELPQDDGCNETDIHSDMTEDTSD